MFNKAKNHNKKAENLKYCKEKCFNSILYIIYLTIVLLFLTLQSNLFHEKMLKNAENALFQQRHVPRKTSFCADNFKHDLYFICPAPATSI